MNELKNDIVITLPDGSKREYVAGITVMDIATSIGPGLAKSTIAGEVNGKLTDACDPVYTDADVRITARFTSSSPLYSGRCAYLLYRKPNAG